MFKIIQETRPDCNNVINIFWFFFKNLMIIRIKTKNKNCKKGIKALIISLVKFILSGVVEENDI